METTTCSFVPPPDAEAQWQQLESLVQGEHRAFFDGEGPIAGARAPGRLDVMGGVADYSGSLVLEMPIAHGACVAWQWRPDRVLRIRSVGAEADGFAPEVTLSLDDLLDTDGRPRPPAEVRDRLTGDPATRWAAYVAGCFHVMLSAYTKYPRLSDSASEVRIGEQGANVLVYSNVPLGAGVSSSAALEVASMHVLSEAAGIHPSDLTLAAWCQRAENMIVGAPCGIMDQVTSALGRENALVVLRCQPHDLLGNQRVPPGWRFVGIDSRVKHSVGGNAYTQARIGAFMGLKYVQIESGKTWNNYLCRLTPHEFSHYRDFIPETLTGDEYFASYDFYPDRAVTFPQRGENYRPRACAEHPVLDNDRVRQFFGLMQVAEMRALDAAEAGGTVEPDTSLLQQAGELMYESHASYSDNLALGSPETDLLVELVRALGPSNGLYGARVTGGGAGGTVAILADTTPGAEAALEAVCRDYTSRTGNTPRAIVGSSPGALSFGVRYITRG